MVTSKPQEKVQLETRLSARQFSSICDVSRCRVMKQFTCVLSFDKGEFSKKRHFLQHVVAFSAMIYQNTDVL